MIWIYLRRSLVNIFAFVGILLGIIFSKYNFVFNTLISISIFSVVISILNHSGLLNLFAKFLSPIFGNSEFISGFITGIIELTNGLNNISNIHVKAISTNILICAFLLGFAGISIMLQILSVISKEKLSIKPYIAGKILQAILGTLYTFVILQIPIFNFNL